MDLLKRPRPYFYRVFCPRDGFSKPILRFTKTTDVFSFFLFWGGVEGGGVRGGSRGVRFIIKMEGGGAGRRRGRGKGSGGMSVEEGGGLNFFFFGAEMPTK